MPTPPDMTTDTTDGDRAVPAEGSALPEPGSARTAPGIVDSAPGSTGPGHESAAPVLDALQHQVAVFARRAEQTRLGGLGQARNSMDRAAYLLLNRLDQEGPMGVKALAAGMGIDSSTVTRQVAPLVESGLVKRTSHPEDGRAVVLQLSPRGALPAGGGPLLPARLMELLTEDWTRGGARRLLRAADPVQLRAVGLNPASRAPPPDARRGGQGTPAS